MMRHSKLKLALAAVLVATPLYAQTPWIHVEVDEGGDEDSHVKVNLPLSVVKIALEAAPERIASQGRVRVGDHADVEVEEIRRLWRELRDAGDAEFASIESDEERVTIRREGDVVMIEVHEVEESGDGTEVLVEVPVEVIDALLAGEGDELDVLGALRELEGRRGELVRVADGRTRVRVWIDERD